MLRAYTDKDFIYLEEWITDAALLFRFSGPDWKFPLTQVVLNDYIGRHPQRQFYMALADDGIPYGFGEIIDGDAFSPRLGRLLIGKSENRGKGLGQRFVKELLDECIRKTSPPEIYLYVFEDNEAGKQCYLNCGFEFCGDEHSRMNHEGREVKVLKMVYKVV